MTLKTKMLKQLKMRKFPEKDMYKSFHISSVCREDLVEKFGRKKAESITDSEMEWLARKMGDCFCDCCYWIALEDGVERILEDK